MNPTRPVCVALACALLLGLAPAAHAQPDSLPDAIDRAGSAVNKKMNEIFGPPLRPGKPKATSRAKPKPAAAAKPPLSPSPEAAAAARDLGEAKLPPKPSVATVPPAKPVPAPQAGPAPRQPPPPADTAARAAAVPLPPPRPLPRATALPAPAALPATPVPAPAPTPAPAVSTAARTTAQPLPPARPQEKPAQLAVEAPPAAPDKPAPDAVPLPQQRPAGADDGLGYFGGGYIGTLAVPDTSAAPAPPLPGPAQPAPAASPPVGPASQRTAALAVPVPLPRPGIATPAALAPASESRKPGRDDFEGPSLPAQPAADSPAAACPSLASADIAVFAPAESPSPRGGCGIEQPVRLAAVRMSSGRLVPLEPAALLRCDMAEAVARWIREEVDPAVATLGSPLDKVMVAASYDCRPRNGVRGAKMSEHGRGNAMDTRGYKLENGHRVLIGGKGDEAMPVDFQNRLKASACGHFKTILGPGSDGYHEEHLHVDLAPRRSAAALCRWTINDAPAKTAN